MIVIPMAGLSRRFTDAGYPLPKYMLPLWDGTCFDYAVGSFAGLFASERFLFVVRSAMETPAFVAARSAALGIAQHDVVVLDEPTAGQGETVEIGIDRAGIADGEALTIFNIDTFRPGFSPPATEIGDGYLEVFRGSGSNWSFVAPAADGSNRVSRTTEKDPISDLCCTGLYQFARAGDFRAALAVERVNEHRALAELYVAPIYNHLIAGGKDIRYTTIEPDEVIFCGVPAEYEALRAGPVPTWARAIGGAGA